MEKPVYNSRILELLEACRPGSDDLSDPAMASLNAQMAASRELDDLYERLQKLDGCLAAAFHDVPVPDGLADRILARLNAAPTEKVVTDTPALSGDAMAESLAGVQPVNAAVRPLRFMRRFSRFAAGRPILAGGMAAALAAIVLLAVVGAFRRMGSSDWQISPESAIVQFNSDPHDGGMLLDARPAPSGYPVSEFLSLPSGARWRDVGDFQGRKAVAYDFQGPQGAGATLYVLRGKAAGLSSGPPWPPHTTGNRAVGWWQEEGLVYVLVIEGDAAEYRQLLQSGSGPVT
ncbi:MAG: hypothetical protein ACLQNE_16780 [Thermoguttaceae bacterium]